MRQMDFALISTVNLLSVGVLILHEVQQCTQKNFHYFDQHPQMLRKKYFFRAEVNQKSICGCWSNWWKKFRVHC
jgi:hypothetical protein